MAKGLKIAIALLGLCFLCGNRVPSARVSPQQLRAYNPLAHEPQFFRRPPQHEAKIPTHPLRLLALQAKQLSPNDQEGLERLFEEARALIQENESEQFKQLEENLEWWVRQPLEKSLFTLMALVQFSRDPVRTVAIVFDNELPAKVVGIGHHGEAETLVHRQATLQSFALRYLRKKIDDDTVSLSSEESDRLLGYAVEAAKKAPSLDVAIEGAHYISLLSHEPKRDALTVLDARPDLERPILSAILDLQ